jgi:hypothetical protein
MRYGAIDEHAGVPWRIVPVDATGLIQIVERGEDARLVAGRPMTGREIAECNKTAVKDKRREQKDSARSDLDVLEALFEIRGNAPRNLERRALKIIARYVWSELKGEIDDG